MLRLLFFGLFVFCFIIETQDAMFTNGRSLQDVIDETMNKAMTKVSKKLQNKLDVLKDNKHALKIWKLYKRFYHRNYSTAEEEKERFGKFIDNLKLIVQENFRFDKGNKTFKLQLNEFGDMNIDEFRKKLTGLNTDGQGEVPPGEYVDTQPGARIKRFLVDTIKKKVKDKIKKKLSPDPNKKRRPGGSGIIIIPGGSGYSYPRGGGYSYPGGGSSYSFPGSSGVRINPSAKKPSSSGLTKASVDYRPHMNPVENQGRCGSCYAFAVTAAIEGTHALKTGSRFKLSKQQLVDCSDNNGCSGGYLSRVYSYVKQQGGLEPDESYPYKTSQAFCKLKARKVGAIKGYGNTPNGDEEQMKKALSEYGPLAAAIHTTSDLQFYSASKSGRGSDIIDIPGCSKQVDHAIAIVGYGTENGKDYWLVRNSWGSNWGIDGYFKVARNKNMCGIATYGYYTIV